MRTASLWLQYPASSLCDGKALLTLLQVLRMADGEIDGLRGARSLRPCAFPAKDVHRMEGNDARLQEEPMGWATRLTHFQATSGRGH